MGDSDSTAAQHDNETNANVGESAPQHPSSKEIVAVSDSLDKLNN